MGKTSIAPRGRQSFRGIRSAEETIELTERETVGQYNISFQKGARFPLECGGLPPLSRSSGGSVQLRQARLASPLALSRTHYAVKAAASRRTPR
jgi:hypothetical protein